jgi:hypothetical protein
MTRFVSRRRVRLVAAAGALAVVAFASAGSPLTAASSSRPTAAGTSHVRFGDFALSNWAGYIALGKKDEFTTATASWVEPTVTCLKDGDLYAPWVGIDGDGDKTVEQTGVATSCSSGSPVEAAWYEMYPKAPKYYSNTIEAGDTIDASVSFSDKKFTLTISDTTRGWTESVTKKLASAKRLSAEAVIEAPGGFPAIKSVNFTGVELNGEPLAGFDPVASESDTGGTTIYGPTAITNGDDFSIVPQS